MIRRAWRAWQWWRFKRRRRAFEASLLMGDVGHWAQVRAENDELGVWR